MIINFPFAKIKWGITLLVYPLFLLTSFGQQTIAAVKNLQPGTVVTTSGTITAAGDFGNLKYIQDYTAGIALYTPLLSFAQLGDSIIITGVVSIYKDEIQLYPVNTVTLVANNRPVQSTTTEDFDSISNPLFTSRHASISCVAIQTCEPTFEEGAYQAYDQFGNVARAIIYDGSELIGQPIPTGPLALSGIWTFSSDQYQLLLQDVEEKATSSCHLIQPPVINYTNGDLTLTAGNLPFDSTWIQYGIASFDQMISLGKTSNVDEVIDNLISGEIYQSRIMQITLSRDTFYSPLTLLSAPSSSSPIEIFFNRNVDATYSDGSAPVATGPAAIEVDLISRIDQVQHSLDIAMYNTGRSTFVAAVKRAKQRGVTIRYIADDETSNSALDGETAFPILYRGEDGIMHNKFVIADADESTAWLWTGSTNWTSNQLASDPNHAYVIHDKALALNYRREFDEMWGSSLTHDDSRVGEQKSDNTSHLFSFNGIDIESYFSPSDEPDCHILEAISTADHHIEIGLLLLTSGTLIDKIIELHQDGINVRVILEDESSSTYAVARLRAEGVPLAIHTQSAIFHHKYAIVDEGFQDSDPLVVTGSHNWTFSADHINDENTLIVHDQSFTNIFRQEFEARWNELEISAVEDNLLTDLIVYPNPATHGFYFSNPLTSKCLLSLFNASGMLKEKYEIGPNEIKYCALATTEAPGFYALKSKWPDHHAVTGLWICPD